MFGSTFVPSGNGNKIERIQFATQLDLNPLTPVDTYPYALTLDAAAKFVKLTFGYAIVGAHDSFNYYTFCVYLRYIGSFSLDAIIASTTTQDATTGLSSYTKSLTSFYPSSVSGPALMFIRAIKTGAPSDIYMYTPMFQVVFT